MYSFFKLINFIYSWWYTLKMKEKKCTIFKKIIDKDVPAHIIYEDDKFLVFLDAFPRNPGHTLVIPKQETLWVWDVDDYEEYFRLVRRVAQAQKKAFNVEMILMLVHGEEVPHAHVHLRPQIDNDGTERDFELIASKIKKELDI